VAGASSAVMAHFCDRVGARRLLWIALFAWSVLLCVLALTHDKWSFGVVLVLVEVAGGSIDTAMNAEASHRLMSSPKSLVRLHALFNTGALTGAAVAALGTIKDPKAVPPLLDALHDSYWFVRSDAADALGRRRPWWVWAAPFAVMLTVLLARNAFLFSAPEYEDADMGANSILIEQADVGNHQWRIVHFQMVMSGRLVFKTKSFDTTEDETEFVPVPVGLGYTQAIRMLRSDSGKAEPATK